MSDLQIIVFLFILVAAAVAGRIWLYRRDTAFDRNHIQAHHRLDLFSAELKRLSDDAWSAQTNGWTSEHHYAYLRTDVGYMYRCNVTLKLQAAEYGKSVSGTITADLLTWDFYDKTDPKIVAELFWRQIQLTLALVQNEDDAWDYVSRLETAGKAYVGLPIIIADPRLAKASAS
jgi:hypothetical protein